MRKLFTFVNRIFFKGIGQCILLMVIFILLISCQVSPKSKLLGTWYASTTHENRSSRTDINYILVLNADNTGSLDVDINYQGINYYFIGAPTTSSSRNYRSKIIWWEATTDKIMIEQEGKGKIFGQDETNNVSSFTLAYELISNKLCVHGNGETITFTKE